MPARPGKNALRADNERRPSESAHWVTRAACRGRDPEMWFDGRRAASLPAKSQRRRFNPDAELAKAICESCPVRLECLREAVAAQLPWGIFGGLTWRQRRRLIKDSAAAKDATR
jgi:WhiB family redox-sensing transcriptional regulator